MKYASSAAAAHTGLDEYLHKTVRVVKFDLPPEALPDVDVPIDVDIPLDENESTARYSQVELKAAIRATAPAPEAPPLAPAAAHGAIDRIAVAVATALCVITVGVVATLYLGSF